MEITLSELRIIAAQCAALSDANVLGFMTDIALDAMRERAVKRIQREPAFKELQDEKKAIFNRIETETEGYQDLTPQQKSNVLSTHPDFVAFQEKEKTEFWDKVVKDIDFEKVVLKQEHAETTRFRDTPYMEVISIDNMGLSIPLYPSLKELIRKGLIIVE